MTEREAMLEAVLAAPSDDGPRLILADWLEEHPETCPEPWSIPALRYPGEWRFDQQSPSSPDYDPARPAHLIWMTEKNGSLFLRFDCGPVGMRCPNHHPWQRQEPFACRHRAGQWLCYPCYQNRPLEVPPARLDEVEFQSLAQAFGAQQVDLLARMSSLGDDCVPPACVVSFDCWLGRLPPDEWPEVRLVRVFSAPSQGWLFSRLVVRAAPYAIRWYGLDGIRVECISRGPVCRITPDGALTPWTGEQSEQSGMSSPAP